MNFGARIGSLLRFARYFAIKVLSLLVFPRRRWRKIWLFAERGNDVCDNAWALFRYVREREPHRRVYYVLEKDSPYREDVRGAGKILRRGSFLHLLLYFLPTVKISTHIFGGLPDTGLFASRAGRRFLRAAGATVFLQHGVIKNDIPALYAENTDLALFVCSAAPEYAFVGERFGYPDGVVRELGLPRFDLLYDAPAAARQILFFPTWRANLKTSADFAASDYAAALRKILINPRMDALLEKYNARLVFAPHFELRGFLREIPVCGKRISVDTGDVGALIRSSAALITDESSVMFDFAYMGRPVIYAQADGLCDSNYPAGWFDCERDGFGEITRSEDELLAAVERVLARDFRAEEKYLRRGERVFPHRDRENRKRCHDAILEVAKNAKLW